MPRENCFRQFFFGSRLPWDRAALLSALERSQDYIPERAGAVAAWAVEEVVAVVETAAAVEAAEAVVMAVKAAVARWVETAAAAG